MWMSQREKQGRKQESASDMGVMTMGSEPAVLMGGERRWAQVCTPGGYRWRPAPGDQVLVIKAGDEQESPCVAGVCQQQDQAPPAGEVHISGGDGQVKLTAKGVELEGDIYINGKPLAQAVKEILGL